MSYFATIFLFCFCSLYLNLFPAEIIYDNFIAILGAMNGASLLFCLILYLKGKYLPTTNDTLIRGNFIADYYWGIELYPTIFSVHVKQFTNCRFGMMSWVPIIISFAYKQYLLNDYVLSDSMIVSCFLQFLYVTTFFYYELGYFFTMDIQHDRAGFYLCWGCLLWVNFFEKPYSTFDWSKFNLLFFFFRFLASTLHLQCI